MSPHSGTCVNILRLCFLSLLLSIAEAFKLSNPPSTFPGNLLNVSWTSSPDDPSSFDLGIGFCGNFNSPLLFLQLGFETNASSFRTSFITETLPSGLEPPAACFIKAFDSNTKGLIDSSPVELIAVDSTFTSLSSISAAPNSFTPTLDTIVTGVLETTVPTASPSTIPSPPPSTVLPFPESALLLSSSAAPLPAVSIISTTSGTTLSATSESPPFADISTTTPIQSSATSEGAKKTTGPLVGEVLGGIFGFIALVSIFIALWFWCRRHRHRRQLRSATPFISDETYVQRMSKREEFKNERTADGTAGTLDRTPQSSSTDQIYTERVDSVGGRRDETGPSMRMGPGPVEEEVTRLRERLNALEDQFRSAVITPPKYSSY
ncbi:hypothetical protein C0995_012273 [Termitomyces sp. Mi166|nr:hypothetical protein C0995_012273 [Termitomyces sp. Mi166\